MRIETNRRTFLGAAAALAAGSQVRLGAAPAATVPFKIGVASYSLREFPRAEAIKMIQALHVHYVSIKSFHLPYELSPGEIAKGAQEFRDAGIEVLSGGNIDLKKPEELRKMFQYAKAAGMPMMVCAPSHATLDAVEKLIKEFNIKAAIHTHGPEDHEFPNPEAVLTAVKGRDPRFGLCMDVGHSARTGIDVVEWVRKSGSRLLDMHFKDLTDFSTARSQVAVGQGKIPVPEIFKTLMAMNYQGGVMLEYEINPRDPLPGMIESIAYERGVLAGLTAT